MSERTQPDGALNYDLSWLNGPASGTYGFTIGRSAIASDEGSSNVATGMTREELTNAVRGFVESFYEPGGIGSGDFPDHISRERGKPMVVGVADLTGVDLAFGLVLSSHG